MVTSRRRAAAWVSAGILTAACGNSPTTPDTPDGEPFLTGPATLSVSSDVRGCSPTTPGWGANAPRIVTPVTVVAEGTNYIMRPQEPRFGDAVMTIQIQQRGLATSLLGGRARSTLIDETTIAAQPHPHHVGLAGPGQGNEAILFGLYFAEVNGAQGRFFGSIVYTDVQDGQMTCVEANWSLTTR